MPSAPIDRLLNECKYEELRFLYNNSCKKHGHRYIEHYGCYLHEFPHKEKIAFFDIESGGSLSADFGYCFCYCIKELNGKVFKNCITPKEVHDPKVRDKRLVRDLCNHLKQYDLVVVYYGNGKYRHDLPFVRTRAVKWGLEFPPEKILKVMDVYDTIKLKFKLARNRMNDACRLFNIPLKNDAVNPEIWQSALTGQQKALDYIVNHCIEDVKKLEKLYKLVVPYRNTRSNL